MTGASLIAFLLAVYLPQALFKTCAERYIDLGRRKNVSQFDEIVAPIFPSLLLHMQSLAIVQAVCALQRLLPFEPWRFPGPDWATLLTLSDRATINRVGAMLSDWDAMQWPISYVTVLALVTFVNGMLFGRGALMGIYAAADEQISPGARKQALPTGRGWGRFKSYVAAIAFKVWKLFYWDSFVTVFPWSVLKPFVFVKTKDGSLFHGRFESYETTREGDIDRLVLRQASRFTRRQIREALKEGEHPLRPLKGVLVLKWSEIADINTTVPQEIRDLWIRWENIRTKSLPPQI